MTPDFIQKLLRQTSDINNRKPNMTGSSNDPNVRTYTFDSEAWQEYDLFFKAYGIGARTTPAFVINSSYASGRPVVVVGATLSELSLVRFLLDPTVGSDYHLPGTIASWQAVLTGVGGASSGPIVVSFVNDGSHGGASVEAGSTSLIKISVEDQDDLGYEVSLGKKFVTLIHELLHSYVETTSFDSHHPYRDYYRMLRPDQFQYDVYSLEDIITLKYRSSLGEFEPNITNIRDVETFLEGGIDNVYNTTFAVVEDFLTAMELNFTFTASATHLLVCLDGTMLA